MEQRKESYRRMLQGKVREGELTIPEMRAMISRWEMDAGLHRKKQKLLSRLQANQALAKERDATSTRSTQIHLLSAAKHQQQQLQMKEEFQAAAQRADERRALVEEVTKLRRLVAAKHEERGCSAPEPPQAIPQPGGAPRGPSIEDIDIEDDAGCTSMGAQGDPRGEIATERRIPGPSVEDIDYEDASEDSEVGPVAHCGTAGCPLAAGSPVMPAEPLRVGQPTCSAKDAVNCDLPAAYWKHEELPELIPEQSGPQEELHATSVRSSVMWMCGAAVLATTTAMILKMSKH